MHNIPLQKQSSSSNCVQTSVSMFLSFYNINYSPDEVEAAIPVRTNAEGEPIGTMVADIGTWLRQNKNVNPMMHVFDVQIIDRSWCNLTQNELLNKVLETQAKGISTALTIYAQLLIDAYVQFLKSGGYINIIKCTNDLLQSLLAKGPILAIVSYNYIYDYPRSSFNPESKNYEPNSIDGKAIEHAIVVTGYSDGSYYYNDPDSEMGGQLIIKDDVLIGAICTAQLNSNNYLLTIEK